MLVALGLRVWIWGSQPGQLWALGVHSILWARGTEGQEPGAEGLVEGQAGGWGGGWSQLEGKGRGSGMGVNRAGGFCRTLLLQTPRPTLVWAPACRGPVCVLLHPLSKLLHLLQNREILEYHSSRAAQAGNDRALPWMLSAQAGKTSCSTSQASGV